jgi:hypothetical protein
LRKRIAEANEGIVPDQGWRGEDHDAIRLSLLRVHRTIRNVDDIDQNTPT